MPDQSTTMPLPPPGPLPDTSIPTFDTLDAQMADDANAPIFEPTEQERKAYAQFRTRYDRMRTFAAMYQHKFDKNYRYYRGHQYAKYGKDEVWRSDVNVPIIFPRVQHYLARMNDKLPDVVVKPRSPESVDKAERVRSALDYLLDVSGAKEAFSHAKYQGVLFGTGVVGVFYSNETKLERTYIPTPNGSEELVTRDVPVHAEQIRIQKLDIYDTFLDSNASSVQDAEDCVIRMLVPVEEARRRYWSIGNRYGKFLKRGMGNVNDSRNGRLETTQALAERGTAPPTILPDGSVKHIAPSGSTPMPTSDMVELCFYFNQKKDSYQVWCNEIPLLPLDTPNPYDHKKLPIALWRNIAMPGELFGLGEPDVLEPYQDMLNEVRNSRLDQVTLSIFKTIFLGPGAGLRPEDMRVGPLFVNPVKDASQITTFDVPPVGAEIYKEEELLRQDAEQVSGMSDINNASEQRATDTATGLNIQIQSMEERLNEKMRSFEQEMFGPVLELCRKNMVQFWDDQKIFAVTGSDGAIHAETITKEDLDSDILIDVEPASGLPPNRLAMREQFLKFFNIVAPIPNVVLDELIRMLGEQFEVKNIDDLLVSVRQVKQQKHADAENEQMLRGMPAAVKEVYRADHELHLMRHQELLPMLAQMDPAKTQLILSHIQEHQNSIPVAPMAEASMPQDGGSQPLMNYQDSIPDPVNTVPVNPVVNPGADSYGA